MTKTLFALLTAMMLFTTCKAPVKERKAVEFITAEQYNNSIANRQMRAVEMILQFNKVFKTNLTAANTLVDSAVLQFNVMIREVSNMPAWQGKTDYRDKALALLQYYQKAFQKDCKRHITIMKDGSVSWTESTKIDQMIKTQNTSTEKLLAAVRNEQNVFALENKIVIVKNEEQQALQRKMDEVHINQ